MTSGNKDSGAMHGARTADPFKSGEWTEYTIHAA